MAVSLPDAPRIRGGHVVVGGSKLPKYQGRGEGENQDQAQMHGLSLPSACPGPRRRPQIETFAPRDEKSRAIDRPNPERARKRVLFPPLSHESAIRTSPCQLQVVCLPIKERPLPLRRGYNLATGVVSLLSGLPLFRHVRNHGLGISHEQLYRRSSARFHRISSDAGRQHARREPFGLLRQVRCPVLLSQRFHLRLTL